MDTTEVIFSLAIAILYPFFFNKLTKQIVGYDKINEMCDKYNKNSDVFVLNSWSTFDRHSEKRKNQHQRIYRRKNVEMNAKNF